MMWSCITNSSSRVFDESVVLLLTDMFQMKLESTARFNSLLPTVNVSPLKLYSVSSINLYGASNYNIFSNHLRIRLSPIKSPILLKYKNPYKRNSMYPNISKGNAKSCTCCNHLICQLTIISSVNHRQFSVVNNFDLD